ncbi:hypothetical protein EV196_10270 [Mariniflexile fucanivorans]|uniref:Uncharacterized protein n=1 Tax=Mariniflexile fucanivorans TaxID=264023 RepID=A0A4R1RMT4_9FLAO|nr:DUF6266 family protein [Mariniflexile fucanivorans]TCL67514.1 hypothetical protein EV196_10270 [Mariniflexile fucanivorans]
MGTFSKGILGGFSGKVGNVVGARWRGKDIMRSLPQRGNYTPTQAQLDQRDRFATAIKFLTPIKEILSAYFGKQQGDKSSFNLATGYHIKYALLPDPLDGYVIDYPKVLIGKGDLRGISNGTVALDVNQTITITWDDNSGQGNASGSDGFVVVVYCEALDLFVTANPAGTRNLTMVQIPLPAYWAGQLIHVWATFATDDAKLAATSSYLGTVTLA